MESLVRAGEAGKSKVSFYVIQCGLPLEGVAQIEGDSSYSK